MGRVDTYALDAPTTRERAEVRRLNAAKESARRTGQKISEEHRAAITAGMRRRTPEQRREAAQKANRVRGCEIFATKVDAERARKARRRARKRDSFVADVVAREIFERDGYICQLCGEPTNPEAESSSDWYPSVDHIVPLSHPDGTHEPANVQCAHRHCNIRKRARLDLNAFVHGPLATVA